MTDSPPPTPTLFEDIDGNPFAINPPDDLPADAAPLREKQADVTAAVSEYVCVITDGDRADLHLIVSLAVEATYTRLGYTLNQSPAELRDQPDPTPTDFRDTLIAINDDPEEYVRCWQVSKRTGHDAKAVLRLLPRNGDWETGAPQPADQPTNTNHDTDFDTDHDQDSDTEDEDNHDRNW